MASFRNSLLITTILMSVIVLLATEFLSVFHLINELSITIFWLSFSAVTLFLLVYTSRRKKNVIGVFRSALTGFKNSNTFFDYLIICLILAIFILIFITGISSAPNNWDSMTYHLGRIIHWIQNQSLAPFATHIERQLFQPPLAEIFIVHLQLLTKSDLFAFLVQFYAMIGSIVAASLITLKLGGSYRAQLLSALFVATIPMGILQTSSTQNDYVVSFFIISFVYFLIVYIKDQTWYSIILSGTSLGLAICTKQTSILFAIPFLLLLTPLVYKWIIARDYNAIKKFLLLGIASAITGIILPLGYFIRNYQVWHDILGRPASSGPLQGTGLSLDGLFLTMVAHIGNHIPAVGPLYTIFYELLESIIGLFDLSLANLSSPYGSFAFPPLLFPHEDLTGNPFSLLLIIASIIVIVVKYRDTRTTQMNILYIICCIFCFIAFSAVIAWQPWSSRLMLPLFILFAPLVGIVLSKFVTKRGFIVAITLLMVISATPYLFLNESRPLMHYDVLGIQTTGIAKIIPEYKQNKEFSIIYSNRTQDYFRNKLFAENKKTILQDHLNVMEYIISNNISKVGLIFGENDWEYPLWAIARYEMSHPIHVEHVNVRGQSASFENKRFIPEIIITTSQNYNAIIRYDTLHVIPAQGYLPNQTRGV